MLETIGASLIWLLDVLIKCFGLIVLGTVTFVGIMFILFVTVSMVSTVMQIKNILEGKDNETL